MCIRDSLFVRSIILLRRANRRRAAVIWAILWLAAGITILRPGTTLLVAHLLGIGRGTDLVLYFFVIAFLMACLLYTSLAIFLVKYDLMADPNPNSLVFLSICFTICE